MARLDGKRIVITGGNSGIGLASAQAFAREGGKVLLLGRDQETLDAARDSLGDAAAGAVRGDVASHDDLDRLYDEAKDALGEIDVLFVIAGVADSAPFAEASSDHFDKVMGVNVKGAFFTIQKALPHLADGASVVITGSCVNELGMAGMSVYGMTKAAVRHLARTLTAELADRNVRVNVLQPGPIETPLFGRIGLTEEEVQGMAEVIQSKVPAGRFGKAEEIANAAVFLASDESAYMRGAELTVDGGMIAV
jgi:NAD(P)-dependent dehydrogenase (short-subunit alcohol dehydrogenase family)